ncbi:hypothetical protein NM688_g8136 [Phlebia brevispora]|uniref:Uncharacterized protein n=1 Tax=Phlebia brevispora TaxID=194682 RepID=A0ACC1RWV3_9APHY|nr:hypothetical protein NM688_g8136 [Phlebia brevispora]
MRRLDDDKDDDAYDDETSAPYILPPPTPAVAVTGKNKRLHRTRLTMCGRTIDISALRHPLNYFGFSRAVDGASRRRRRGLLSGVVHDILRVAWMPIVSFMTIAWVMFR